MAIEDYEQDIIATAQQYGLDPEMLRSVVMQESSGNPLARGSSKEQGLMQLMPSTGAEMGLKDPYNPQQNLDAGARYLASLVKRFNGDISKALQAYNAGPGAVSRGLPSGHPSEKYVTSVLSRMTPGAPGPIVQGVAPPTDMFQKLDEPGTASAMPASIMEPTGGTPLSDPTSSSLGNTMPPISNSLDSYSPEDPGEQRDLMQDLLAPDPALAAETNAPDHWGPGLPGGARGAAMFGGPAIAGILGLLLGGKSKGAYALGGFAKGMAGSAHEQLNQIRKQQQELESSAFQAAQKNFDKLQELQIGDLKAAGVPDAELQEIDRIRRDYASKLMGGKLSPKDAAELNRISGQVMGRVDEYKARQTGTQQDRAGLARDTQDLIATNPQLTWAEAEAQAQDRRARMRRGVDMQVGGVKLEGLNKGEAIQAIGAQSRDTSAEARMMQAEARVAQGWESLKLRAKQLGIAEDRLEQARRHAVVGPQINAMLAKINWYALQTGNQADVDLYNQVWDLAIQGSGAFPGGEPNAITAPPDFGPGSDVISGAGSIQLPTPNSKYTVRRVR